MSLNFLRISPNDLSRYAAIPIAFEVRACLRVEPVESGLGGLRLVEEKVDPPYTKDYDRMGQDSGPGAWSREFNLERWEIYLAQEGGRTVGGLALAVGVQGPFILENSRDTLLLWDLRVLPEARGQGCGRVLFEFAAGRARALGFKRLAVETQNVNVPACRFYAAMGCTLGAIHRYGYTSVPEAAGEAMLLWYKEL